MVIYFEWHRTAMDPKSRSGLPMPGEDTGLGALASPLVGYLGKVQERAASLEYCPWCTSKGLTYALRSYRINLQESITLCTNPQCLFPLVSRSLEDVLASLVPVEPTVGSKRKHALALEKEESIKPSLKRLRSSELDSLGPQSTTDTLIGQAEQGAVNIGSSGQQAAPKTDGEQVNGYHRDSPVAETGWATPQDEDDVRREKPESAARTDVFAAPTRSVSAGQLQSSSDALLTTDGDEPALSPRRDALGISEAEDDLQLVKSPPKALSRHHGLDSNQSLLIDSTKIESPSPQDNEKPTVTDITCEDIRGVKSETEDLSCAAGKKLEELVPVPAQLFWRNTDNLCWLDSLLVALVNCKSLRKCKPKDEPQRSSVWRLMSGYEDICAAIQIHQQLGRDGVVRVPNRVLQKANEDLQSLRMSVFKLLQPKLQCKLGQRETPVFALPLLLATDSWLEPLFQSTFHWEFKCSECKVAMKQRVTKTLPTFTKISPDWRPLHAVHFAPCNVCRKKNQRRAMILERVPPVFELHFVEGLPDNDVSIYSFTFKGKRYSVTTVIQYDQRLKHFIAWICNPDGSWLEYDDLKHPNCKTHRKLPVPAEEIHIVFWEAEEGQESGACSPSTTFADSPPPESQTNPSPADKDCVTDEPLAPTPDDSLLTSHNDTDIVCALAASEDTVMDTTVMASIDASIGSTTLLDAFEGLTHNDIITLTLVELNGDSETQPVKDDGQTADVRVLDSTPDSSSAPTASEASQGPDVELLATSNSSETQDDSSNDLAVVPRARGGRGRRGVGRGRTASRQTGKKPASSKAAPPNPSPASSEPSLPKEPASAAAAAQDCTAPVETTQQASPASSADTSATSASQESPAVQAASLQHSRWSFLLSKHPLSQANRPTDNLAPVPVAQVKPTLPSHSTPNPVRRQQIPGGLVPKPQLKTEESQGLPLKAAEMYDGFGVKSASAPSPPLQSPALLSGKSKPFQPITAHHQKLLMNTTVASGASFPVPGAKGLPEISSSKKHSSHSSKVPPGLNDTDALRYKLIKKLKAKKKKLAKLNQMLGQQGGARLRPDSTDLGSPDAVTSSTYDASVCDDFLSDLLSPATTASNLSPDSSGFLEMIGSGQDDQLDSRIGALPQVSARSNEPKAENFLEDFLSQAVAQRPTEMETEALSALELFI